MNWLEQFNENYYGRSQVAKALKNVLLETYQGASYLPWAVMERAMYQQDPEASFEVMMNRLPTGMVSPVWSYANSVVTSQETGDKVSKTSANFFAHFVIVRATFKGKTIEEVYPILGKKYDAPKVIDAHMVNKSIQRAKAKAASRVTGLGLSLYETGDLQFDVAGGGAAPAKLVPTQPTKPVQVTEPAKVETEPLANVREPVEENAQTQETVVDNLSSMKTKALYKYAKEIGMSNYSSLKKAALIEAIRKFQAHPGTSTEPGETASTFEPQDVQETVQETIQEPVNETVEEANLSVNESVNQAVQLVVNEPDIEIGLQKINKAIINKYSFSISRDDSIAELTEKFATIEAAGSLDRLITTLKIQSGLE